MNHQNSPASSLNRPRRLYNSLPASELGKRDPNIKISVASESGLLNLYHAHRNILIAHSHFFKQNLKKNPHIELEMISLPVVDRFHSFPFLLKYMYQSEMPNAREDTFLYACDLALSLGMARFLHDARKLCDTLPASVLIKHLKSSYQVLKSNEFVCYLSDSLAKILHMPAVEKDFYTLPFHLMFLVIISPELQIKLIKDLNAVCDRYLKAREKYFGEKISMVKLQALKNISAHLVEYKKKMADIESEINHFEFKNTTTTQTPYKKMAQLRESFYYALQNCQKYENFHFTFPITQFYPPKSSASASNSRRNSTEKEVSKKSKYELNGQLEKVDTIKSENVSQWELTKTLMPSSPNFLLEQQLLYDSKPIMPEGACGSERPRSKSLCTNTEWIKLEKNQEKALNEAIQKLEVSEEKQNSVSRRRFSDGQVDHTNPKQTLKPSQPHSVKKHPIGPVSRKARIIVPEKD